MVWRAFRFVPGGGCQPAPAVLLARWGAHALRASPASYDGLLAVLAEYHHVERGARVDADGAQGVAEYMAVAGLDG
ncbi:hypothetical protein GCM10020256_42860 [Streptomyces thermocoprophilus]